MAIQNPSASRSPGVGYRNPQVALPVRVDDVRVDVLLQELHRPRRHRVDQVEQPFARRSLLRIGGAALPHEGLEDFVAAGHATLIRVPIFGVPLLPLDDEVPVAYRAVGVARRPLG